MKIEDYAKNQKSARFGNMIMFDALLLLAGVSIVKMAIRVCISPADFDAWLSAISALLPILLAALFRVRQKKWVDLGWVRPEIAPIIEMNVNMLVLFFYLALGPLSHELIKR